MSATVSQFDAINERQRRMWASGDCAQAAARIHSVAERLCEAADLVAGSRVLDVATGSGSAEIAAARCGCEVTGIDYVPALLERARVRARAEGLAVEFIDGDAEALPFADVFLSNYRPTERAAAALDEAGRADLAALDATASRLPAGGSVASPATYLEILAVRA